MGALATAVRQGKALYVGISSYSPARTVKEAAASCAAWAPAPRSPAPPIPSSTGGSRTGYWMCSRTRAIGCITFSPLAQGMLTDKYLEGVRRAPGRARDLRSPQTSWPRRRWTRSGPSTRSPAERGQTLAQMALAWTLRDGRVTSTLIGASTSAARRTSPPVPRFRGTREIDPPAPRKRSASGATRARTRGRPPSPLERKTMPKVADDDFQDSSAPPVHSVARPGKCCAPVLVRARRTLPSP